MSSCSTPNLDQISSKSGYSTVFLNPLPRRAAVSNNGDRDANSSPPEPPVRDSSSLKYIKYGPGHEKFPSWPVPAASEATSRPSPGGYSTRSKSWTDNTSYPKEKVVIYTRPYMKRQHSQYTQQKLKTVMERSEKIPSETFESQHNENPPNRLYVPNIEHDMQLPGTTDYNLPSPPEREYSQRTTSHKDLGDYTPFYNENLRFQFDGDTENHRLTEKGLEELMEYNKTQDQSPFSSMYDNNQDGIITHIHHQKQISYAQSEGYHSYVSSTDSTSTPFLDRLRRDSHALVCQQPSPSVWEEESRREGRDSVVTTSSGSASSSDTLKWHGSMSDVSVANSSCTYLADQSNQQLIAHSARVQTPQRHRSESVLYMSGGSNSQKDEKRAKHRREGTRNSVNKLKLFPVETSFVKDPAGEHPLHKSNSRINNNSKNRLSLSLQTPSFSVASRAIEFEKQKYSYLDPNKKQIVPDPTLKAIQKKALLSFYERHQQTNNDTNKVQSRAEPQIAYSQQTNRPRGISPKVAHPLRRASSINSYSSRNSRRSSLVSSSDIQALDSKDNGKQSLGQQHSNSCSSLSADLLGPVIVGSSISIDDYASRKPPDRPPKNPNLRTAYPDLFVAQRVTSPDLPPPSPPAVLEDEVFDNGDPLPPPPPECDSWSQDNIVDSTQRDKNSSSRQIPEPQVHKSSSNLHKNIPLHQNIGIPETSIPYSLIKTRPTEHIIQQVRSKPNPLLVLDVQKRKAESLTSSGVDEYNSSNTGGLSMHNITRSKEDSPPPLQPRQMRIYRSMRGDMSKDYRPRLSPPKEMIRDNRFSLLNRSKGSYLTTRKDDAISSDSEAGTYKRAPSPSDHVIPSQVICDFGKNKDTDTLWPHRRQSRDAVKLNGCDVSHKNSLRNVNKDVVKSDNRNCDSDVVDEKVLCPTVLPDVLPANAKMKSRPPSNPHELPIKLKPLYLESDRVSFSSKSPLKTAEKQNSALGPSCIFPLVTSIQSSVSNSSLASLRTTSGISQSNKVPSSTCTSSRTSPKPSLVESPSIINDSKLIVPSNTRHSALRSPPLNSNTFSKTLALSPTRDTQVPLANENDLNRSASPSQKTVDFSSEIEGLRLVQRTELVLRINSSTNDAASQTEKDEIITPCSSSDKEVDEDYERLSQDFVSHLPATSILKTLLVPTPEHKKPSEYVQDLFKAEAMMRIKPRPTTPSDLLACYSPSLTKPSGDNPTFETKFCLPASTTSHEITSPLPCSSVYFTTSEPKAKFLTMYSQHMNQTNVVQDTKDLHRKKDELVNRLSRKLEVLRSEALIVSEECRVNDELGVTVENNINRAASPQEVYKFRLHVEEVGKITSLLLGLSGRLARAENALMNIPDDHPEKNMLESKRNKLQDQLEEAKKLKESIDKRSVNVSNILYKYLSTEEYADYNHFINMKAKLIMDSKEINDKIKLGEEQLGALSETLIISH